MFRHENRIAQYLESDGSTIESLDAFDTYLDKLIESKPAAPAALVATVAPAVDEKDRQRANAWLESQAHKLVGGKAALGVLLDTAPDHVRQLFTPSQVSHDVMRRAAELAGYRAAIAARHGI